MLRISSATVRVAVAIAALCLAALPLVAQETEFDPRRVPFREWVAQGEQEQIPWKVLLSEPQLTFHQRIGVSIRVELSGKALNARGERHNLTVLARMADREGRWIDRGGIVRGEWNERFPARSGIRFVMNVLVQPGEYSVGIVLLDLLTGERSVTRRALKVPALKNDPLPASWRNLPRAEFLGDTDGFETLVRPGMRSRLWLPAPTRRPVHIEVLANLAVSELFAGSRTAHWINLTSVLAALRVLTQIDLPNGRMGVTTVDLLRRKVVFEQKDARRMDWRSLRDTLEQTNPGMISARALETRREGAAFLRELLAERLAAPAAAPDAGSSASAQGTRAEPEKKPQRVVIVLTTGFYFPRGANLAPLQPPPDCGCKVYYLENRVGASNLWDQIPKLLRPLRPQHFRIDRPMDLRRALAVLLEDLRKH